MRERGFNFKMQASLISQITSDGISTVPYETVVSAQNHAPHFTMELRSVAVGVKGQSLAQLSIRENISIF